MGRSDLIYDVLSLFKIFCQYHSRVRFSSEGEQGNNKLK